METGKENVLSYICLYLDFNGKFSISLYAALCHQLERRDVPTSVASLRKQSADHMRGHPGDFLPFLSQQDTGDPFTEGKSF